MSAILKLRGVSKRSGALLAIDNLIMHLNEGEALGVIRSKRLRQNDHG
jgi:ABC-type branched-subunit amino acid transport system ATPase component